MQTSHIFRRARVHLSQSRTFSASCSALGRRAIVYSQNGEPSEVLKALTSDDLPPPPAGTANIRFLLSPVNPADINVIQGVYPKKPEVQISLSSSGLGSQDSPAFVAGNEGVAEITALGEGVAGLHKGDWVIMAKQQSGTWSSTLNVAHQDVTKVPQDGLSEADAAMITVNPPTAYNLLNDFALLRKGDWVVQNGANSAVGRAVIQIAATKGLKTINFVRNRDNFDELRNELVTLGATHVATYDDLMDKAFIKTAKGWTSGQDIRLGLNCVSGKPTSQMARLLGKDAHLVSYGAMSKEPLSLPTSLFIFKNLKCHGFWQSQWYENSSRLQRDQLMETLVNYFRDGQLKSPDYRTISIEKHLSDEEAGQRIRDIMRGMSNGEIKEKVLLRLEETA